MRNRDLALRKVHRRDRKQKEEVKYCTIKMPGIKGDMPLYLPGFREKGFILSGWAIISSNR